MVFAFSLDEVSLLEKTKAVLTDKKRMGQINLRLGIERSVCVHSVCFKDSNFVWLPKTAALQIPQFCNTAIGSKVKCYF